MKEIAYYNIKRKENIRTKAFTVPSLKDTSQQKIKIPSFKIGQRRFRNWFYRKTGFDTLQNPVLKINAQWFDENIYRIDTPSTFISWLQHQDDYFFTRGDIQACENLHQFLSAQARISVIQKAHSAITETETGFKKWYFNPQTQQLWPKEHIYTYPNTPEAKAAIRQTSYIGRFTHIPDILRAWHLTHDRCLIDGLIQQIQDFEKENPIYQGPQWSNISDIATRNAMFCLAYSHLYKSEFATPHTILLLSRQIAACTSHLMKHVNNFDYKLNTTAFISVACSIYFAAATLPWIKAAKSWHQTSHRWLFQGIENQFLPDGGYASGSITEQKCVLHSLSWVYAIALKRHDTLLAQRISNICAKSFTLLQHICDHQSGAYPEIGHHQFDDFPSLSTCDKSDIRPLLACIGYAAHGSRQYKSGPWDESLYWIFDLPASSQTRFPTALSTTNSFPHAGLHTIRDPHHILIFRSGALQHYKNQHADQMHVDYSHYGYNILMDSGSSPPFTALQDKYFFEGKAHNSLTINQRSMFTTDDYGHISSIPNISMIPSTPILNTIGHFAAEHNGFNNIEKGLRHRRLVLALSEGCNIVIDQIQRKLMSEKNTEQIDIQIHWQMARLAYQNDGSHLILQDENMPDFAIKWHCTAPYTSAFYPASSRGQAHAWKNNSDFERSPIHKLEIKTTSKQQYLYAITCFGTAKNLPQHIDFDTKTHILSCDDQTYSLTAIFSDKEA